MEYVLLIQAIDMVEDVETRFFVEKFNTYEDREEKILAYAIDSDAEMQFITKRLEEVNFF